MQIPRTCLPPTLARQDRGASLLLQGAQVQGPFPGWQERVGKAVQRPNIWPVVREESLDSRVNQLPADVPAHLRFRWYPRRAGVLAFCLQHRSQVIDRR